MQWNDNDDVVWPDEEWFELITHDDASSGKWTTFFNPSKYKGKPALVGFIGGQDAIDMEAQTDEEVLDDVIDNLQAMFPTLRRPDRIVVTRWGQDPNFRGAYSFKKVGRDFWDDARHLHNSIRNLHFAGEATAYKHWYGTVTGAWKTGEKEAYKMVGELRNRRWDAPAYFSKDKLTDPFQSK